MSDVGEQRLNLMARDIIGTRLFIDQLVGTGEIARQRTVLFIYSDRDCGKCLTKGIALLNQIAQTMKKDVWAVNITSQQSLPGLDETLGILSLSAGRTDIAAQLNFAPTPLTVLLGNGNKIQSVHFTTVFDDTDREYAFLSDLLDSTGIE